MSFKKINILNLSPYQEDCGVGKYQEAFVREAYKDIQINSDFYKTSPNIIKNMKDKELVNELKSFQKQLVKYDILHIQHEYSLFRNHGEGLEDFIKIAKKLNKKIVITIHTAPSHRLKFITRSGWGLKSWVKYYVNKYKSKKTTNEIFRSFLLADKIIVLNKNTGKELIELIGVKKSKIYFSSIPVDIVDEKNIDRNMLRRKMKAESKDVILATTGFLSDKKGISEAVKCLNFLPHNYKLAILGGVNPNSGDPKVYDDICDLIIKYNLQDRVYMSGYIANDHDLNNLVSGADITLYPYDVEYYKLASSAAVNVSISNKIPVITYPTKSFIEINEKVPNTIAITNSPNYYELSRAVIEDKQMEGAEIYRREYSILVIWQHLKKLYEDLLA